MFESAINHYHEAFPPDKYIGVSQPARTASTSTEKKALLEVLE